MNPKLLVVELWGLGDLLIATPFLQAASKKFEVTLLAKPYAKDLQARFWREVEVAPFIAPWTAFKHKYRMFSWPWPEILALRKLRRRHFDAGLSARWDPRDHLLLMLLRVHMRLGFPRMGSQVFLTHPLHRPDPRMHRYEHWRVVAQALGIELPAREKLPRPLARSAGEILVHTGAGQPIRVWPLPRYLSLVRKLRSENHRVQVACDPDQRNWWLSAGESGVVTPRTVSELFAVVDRAGAFIGNDSGPGHLAAACGVPTFTLFGPQLPEWFSPLHHGAEWFEGKACPYKPCSDYCRFSEPFCLSRMSEEEVWTRIEWFIAAQSLNRLETVPARG